MRSLNYWYLRHYLTPKKHVLYYFVLEWMQFVAGRGIAERRERIFSTCLNLFGKNTLSEQIICQAMFIFKLLQEIKTTLNPHLGVTQYQVYQNCGNPSFFGLRVFSTYRGLFIYCLLATVLICAALGTLHWLIFKCNICYLTHDADVANLHGC